MSQLNWRPFVFKVGGLPYLRAFCHAARSCGQNSIFAGICECQLADLQITTTVNYCQSCCQPPELEWETTAVTQRIHSFQNSTSPHNTPQQIFQRLVFRNYRQWSRVSCQPNWRARFAFHKLCPTADVAIEVSAGINSWEQIAFRTHSLNRFTPTFKRLLSTNLWGPM